MKAQDNPPERMIMQVKLYIQLKFGPTIRTRHSVFEAFLRPRSKVIKMTNGQAWLHLTANTKPPDKLSFTGALKLGKEFRPIEVSAVQVPSDAPWLFVIRKTIQKTSAVIRITAQMHSSVKRRNDNKKYAYSLDFKGVTLRRVLRKLAEFNEYQLSLQEPIPKIKNIKIRFEAPTRAKLINVVCQKFSLQCRVLGTVLWIKHNTPGASP